MMNVSATAMSLNHTDIDNITYSSQPPKVSIWSYDLWFHQMFSYYVMWPVIVVGVAGNILVIAVMRNKIFIKRPLSVYLTAIAISDSVMLVLSGLMQTLRTSVQLNFFMLAPLCATLGFVFNICTLTSSWFVVCVAMERLLVVKFPLKAKQLTSKNKALFAVISQTVVSVIINSFNIWMIDLTIRKCRFRPEFIWFGKVGKGLLLLVGYNILPLVIICVCYITLLVSVLTKKQMTTHASGSRERLTASILYICLSFLLLTSPFCVYVLMTRMNNWTFKPTRESRLFETFAAFVRQFNYGSNFFIYLATNIQFRQVINGFRGKKQNQVSASDTSANINQSTKNTSGGTAKT